MLSDLASSIAVLHRGALDQTPRSAHAAKPEAMDRHPIVAVVGEPGPRYNSQGKPYDPNTKTFPQQGGINGTLRRIFSPHNGSVTAYYPADH